MAWEFFLGVLTGLACACGLVALVESYLKWLEWRNEVWRRWHYEKEEKLKTQDPYCVNPPPTKDKYDHLGGW